MEAQIHQARSEYLDAAIAEINAVANTVENRRDDLAELLRQRAQEAGELAQEKFETFVSLVETYKATKDNER
jgi:ABC-type transporter Mla subunit MlaD